ncbi:MAG: hypothetical protein IKE65_07745 [Clostridia bacterium]|nr:hypothetical protein [Clostridia bacterium]
MLDFRGNWCYYLAGDYFIVKVNGNSYLEYIDENHDDQILYEGAFVRFSKININYVAIENRYEANGKQFDEYALVYLLDEYHTLTDVKIEKEYGFENFEKTLKQHQFTIEKWEEA